MDSTLKQVKQRVKPLAKLATEAKDEVFRGVIAIARGVNYDPKPRRTKPIFGSKVWILSLMAGAVAGAFAAWKRNSA